MSARAACLPGLRAGRYTARFGPSWGPTDRAQVLHLGFGQLVTRLGGADSEEEDVVETSSN